MSTVPPSKNTSASVGPGSADDGAGWIEIGNPKRRTGAPAWSDETQTDAWSGALPGDSGSFGGASSAFELVEEGEEDGAPAETPDAETDADADDLEDTVEHNADAERAETVNPRTLAPVAGAPISLRGVRLRRPPRASRNPRPFRKPAARRGPTSPVGDGSAPTAGQDPDSTLSALEDLWVQGPVEDSGPVGDDADAVMRAEVTLLSDQTETLSTAQDPTRELEVPTGDADDTAPVATEADELAGAGAESEEPTAVPSDRVDPDEDARWTVVAEPDLDPEPEPELDLDPAPVVTTSSDDLEEHPVEISTRSLEEHSEQAASSAPGAPVPATAILTRDGKRRQGAALQTALDVLGPHLRTHRAALVTGGIALLLSVWLLVALPFPLKIAVDAAVAGADVELPAPGGVDADPAGTLTTSVIVLAALVVLQGAARFTGIAALGRVGARVATSLRARLLRHLHRLGPDTGTSASAPSGDQDRHVARPVIDDAAALRDLLSHGGPRLAAGALTLLSALVVTLIVEPLAALVLLAVGILYALPAGLWTRRTRATADLAQAEARTFADTADELVAATGTIQSYGLETRSERGLTEAATRAGRALNRQRRSEALLGVLALLAIGLGVAGAVWVSGPRIAAGTMSPGGLTLVLTYVLITVLVLREMVQHSGTVRAAGAAGARLAALLERRPAIRDPQRTQPVDRVRGEVVFSAVNTVGRAGRPLFETLSLVVPAGQHVALMDASGQESTALLAYLQRFDQPDTGRVLLDRFDTRTVSLSDLRRQIAVVQREPVLFTDTVRENIRIGRPDATEEEVEAAARAAGVDEVIAQLTDGADTVLVRRGEALTDGQRRRIAIARALLRDAPIVVLDAADAELSATERQPVLQALAALVAGRTALVASRDPETVQAMDRVIWVDAGDVVEDAAPAELAARPDSRLGAWLSTQDEPLR